MNVLGTHTHTYSYILRMCYNLPNSRCDSFIVAVYMIEVWSELVGYVRRRAHDYVAAVLGEQAALPVQLLLHERQLPRAAL